MSRLVLLALAACAASNPPPPPQEHYSADPRTLEQRKVDDDQRQRQREQNEQNAGTRETTAKKCNCNEIHEMSSKIDTLFREGHNPEAERMKYDKLQARTNCYAQGIHCEDEK